MKVPRGYGDEGKESISEFMIAILMFFCALPLLFVLWIRGNER